MESWHGQMQLELTGAVAFWTPTGGVPIALSSTFFANDQLPRTIYLEGNVLDSGTQFYEGDYIPAMEVEGLTHSESMRDAWIEVEATGIPLSDRVTATILKADIGTVVPLANRTLHPDAAREPLLLKQTLPADWNGLMQLELTGAVAFWTPTGGVPIVLSETVFTNAQLPQTIYLEGDGCGVGEASFSVVGLSDCVTNIPLQIFGANATLAGVAEADEESPGGSIANRTVHTNVPRTMLTLEACGPYGSPGNLILTWDSSVVQIYAAPSGGTALTQFVTPFHGFNGTNLYVEGIAPGTTTLSWSYSGQPNCTDNIQVSVVKVGTIQYKLNGIWTDVPASFSDIGKDTSITFRALPSPAGAGWPAGFPQWGGDATGSGPEKQVTFSTSGSRMVRVMCGNTISVPVAVDAANTAITITWDAAGYQSDSSTGASTCVERNYTVTYIASADIDANKWLLRVSKIHGGVDITVHTGGSRCPIANPPTTEAEAVDAVTVMKGYYDRGSRGAWHTEAASRAHEEYHYMEWSSIGDHYWPQTEAAIESITTTYHDHATEALAIAAMRCGANGADAKIAAHNAVCRTYWFTLGDSAGDRPYAAGQLSLNAAIISVQNLAAANGWVVPQGVDTPSTADPCYQPWTAYDP